jgi:hypothetical protein
LDSQNSPYDVYVDLVCDLLGQDNASSTPSKHLRRDMQTVRSRTAQEGLSFLTKTLPKLGKALDDAMETTMLSVPREFKRSHVNGSVPAFMQVHFNMAFDGDGRIRDDVPPDVIKHIRQVCFVLYKLSVPYQPKEEARVIESFLAAEGELELPDDCETSGVISAASYIIRDILLGFDPKDVLPRHGPGAVATGELLEKKWDFSRLYRPIHQVYPYYEYFIVGRSRELVDRKAWYGHLERLDEGCAKVVLVPKDSRGPRLISCEPLEYQYVQQGLGRKLMKHLENHWLTRGHVNFSDQSVNGKLALESSRTREYATIDLKDASDRVSLELVRRVFSSSDILRYLEGTRSTSTLLPDGRIVRLSKFAPMGSALCFPVESLVFFAVLVAGVHRRTGCLPRDVAKRIFVYGDDIVVPVEWMQIAVETLERVRLRVNVHKSYASGYFRESCGVDAFKGVVVTPIRIKALWSGRWSDGAACASYVSLANHLAERGYHIASARIFGRLEAIYGKLPYCTKESGVLGRWSRSLVDAIQLNAGRVRQFRDPQRQVIKVKGIKLVPRRRKTKLDSWPRLLKALLTADETPSEVVIPRSTRIKRGWTVAGS